MTIDPKPEVKWDWISEGWKMFTEQWQGWVKLSLGFFIGIFVPVIAAGVFIYLMVFATAVATSSTNAPPQLGFIPIFGIFFIYLILFVWIALASALVNGGMFRAALKQLRGGKIEFRDIFAAKDCFLKILGAGVLEGLLTLVGAVLCIIPALIIPGLFFFTIPLILERGLGVTDAMRESYELTKKNFLMFVLFAFVVGIIAQIGTYACYVGLLATYPLRFTIAAVAYRDIFGLPGARSFLTPAQPGSSYAAPLEPSTISAPPAPVLDKTCPNCQSVLPPTAIFCPRCGRNI